MSNPRDRGRRKISSADLERIKKIKAEKQKKKESFKWHWSLTIFVIGFFLGIISLAWLSKQVVISALDMIIIVLVVASISAVLQYKYFKKTNIIADTMKKAMPFFIAYNIVGIGCISLFVFFIVNKSFASNKIVQEHYAIIGTDPDYLIYRWGNVVYLLEEDVFASDVELRALPFKFYYESKTKTIMEYDFNEGFLGYKVKVDHRLVNKKPS